uniref:Reverse transcriptase domain-containing protein n=1 Tax=Strongyloides venezuelensis TaxID=75913 RepID=A0A0K0EYW9_STRVS
MVIFVTINARRKPTPTTTCRGPPAWQDWKGRSPLNANLIAKEATKLFYQCGYYNFKFIRVYQKQKRFIDHAMRYRVRYIAKKCQESKVTKPSRRGRKHREDIEIKLVHCERFEKKFQAIFKDDLKHRDRLRLNVTNLENGNSCALTECNPGGFLGALWGSCGLV